MSEPAYPWQEALYKAEATWRAEEALPPDEIAFNPDDVPPSATSVIGYRLVRDKSVTPGTFEFRRVIREISFRHTITFAS